MSLNESDEKIQLCPNPNCNNQGWYAVEDGYGGWEQAQCEFCYTVENSMFNYKKRQENITEK